MPIIKSAAKQMRQSEKRRVRNLARKRTAKDAMKTALKLIAEKKTSEATTAVSAAYKQIDLACKYHLYHANNAAHKKSRLARALAKIS